MIKKIFKKVQAAQLNTIIGITRAKVKKARTCKEKVIFLLGTPRHNNIGDLAITRAELRFIKNRTKNTRIIEVPTIALIHNFHFLKELVEKTDIILGHGGGNMGDTYLYEEEMRRNIISTFPGNKIVIFPQTIYFSDTDAGKNELLKTKKVYSQHEKLTLIAREKVSYNTMLSVFPNNKVILTPDIVLSMNETTNKRVRRGALTCIRDDVESTLSHDQKAKLLATLKERYGDVKQSDTTEPTWLYRLERNNFIVDKKLNQFKKSRIVITDRLHGMVFATITGTPCIALTNFNHKVMGTHDWISKLGYIKYASSTDEIPELIDSIEQYGVYNPNEFEKYWQAIATEISP